MLYTFTYWRVSWGTQTGKGNALAIILYTSCTIFTLTWYRIFLGKDQLNNLDTAAAAKSLQSCPTLCDTIDGRPPGSPVPGTLQTRTLEWVAMSFSNEWKWKVKVKSLSRVRLLKTPWTAAYQAPSSMGFSRQECWSGLPLPPPIFSWNALILASKLHLPDAFHFQTFHRYLSKLGEFLSLRNLL